jgi:hypothetical protein
MLAVRLFCHVIVLFVAVAFLFGQLFSGDFSPGATMAGLGGIVAGMLGLFDASTTMRRVVVIFATLGLGGAALHAYEYYASSPLPGNYYAWFLTGPFMAALVVIAWPSLRPRPSPAAVP